MSRKDDLEQGIRKSYGIIRQYEEIIRNEDRPEERSRAQSVIDRQWTLIEDYLAEYCTLNLVPDDIAQIAARFPSKVQGGTIWNGRIVMGSEYVQGCLASMGVEGVYGTREDALEKFAKSLDDEIKKAEDGCIWFVCSSLRGFIVPSRGGFNGRAKVDEIARSKCDIRFLMTDPDVADMRAKQERRAKGAIPREIEDTVQILKGTGVPRERIKYYSGTPTVFAIATSEKMLLNPYPYEAESHRCFSLIVRATSSEDGIYHQYLKYHFDWPWNNDNSREILPDEWDRL